MELTEETRQQLLELIRKGKLGSAIEELLKLHLKSGMRKEALSISSRFQGLQNKRRMGLLSMQEDHLLENQIVASLLDMLETVQSGDELSDEFPKEAILVQVSLNLQSNESAQANHEVEDYVDPNTSNNRGRKPISNIWKISLAAMSIAIVTIAAISYGTHFQRMTIQLTGRGKNPSFHKSISSKVENTYSIDGITPPKIALLDPAMNKEPSLFLEIKNSNPAPPPVDTVIEDIQPIASTIFQGSISCDPGLVTDFRNLVIEVFNDDLAMPQLNTVPNINGDFQLKIPKSSIADYKFVIRYPGCNYFERKLLEANRNQIVHLEKVQ